MSTDMRYISNSHIFVKPELVKLTFTIRKFNKDQKTSIKEFHNSLNQLKTMILNSNSYILSDPMTENYNVTQFYVKKQVHTQVKLVCSNTKESVIISNDLYKKYAQSHTLDLIPKISCTLSDCDSPEFMEVIDGYTTSALVTASFLISADSVIDDILKIVNFCLLNDIDCKYNLTLSEKNRVKYMDSLYIDCVNNGVSNIKHIVNNLPFENPDFTVHEITDPTVSNYGGMMRCANVSEMADCDRNSNSDILLTRELLEELFNINIELSKSVEIIYSI